MEQLLEMLKWIQSIRIPVLDQFFTLITILGEEYFSITILCMVLWCINKRAGYRIGFAYLTSWITNFSIKGIFRVQRPFALDKSIVPIRPETATGFSFPSGHTQSISSLSTALSTVFRKKWMYIAGILLVVLVAFSRMYLGVHTLLDVLCGALIGFGWVFAANAIFDYAERTNRRPLLLILLVPMAIAMVFIHDNDFYKIAGTFTSFVIGYLLDSRYIQYEAKGPFWQKAVTFVMGMAVLLAIKFIGKELLGESLAADYARYFTIGIWITAIGPALQNIAVMKIPMGQHPAMLFGHHLR